MTDTKLDVIDHINELITDQPDGSALTPKLHDVIAEIRQLRQDADGHSAAQAANRRLQAELVGANAELEKLRALAGAAADSVDEPDHRTIKRKTKQAED